MYNKNDLILNCNSWFHCKMACTPKKIEPGATYTYRSDDKFRPKEDSPEPMRMHRDSRFWTQGWKGVLRFRWNLPQKKHEKKSSNKTGHRHCGTDKTILSSQRVAFSQRLFHKIPRCPPDPFPYKNTVPSWSHFAPSVCLVEIVIHFCDRWD